MQQTLRPRCRSRSGSSTVARPVQRGPRVHPDIRAYLEIRTASPSSWAPDDQRLLISSDLSGTAQVHRLDLDSSQAWPRPVAELVQLTDFDEPVGAGYLPRALDDDGPARLLLAADDGGNERHQLFTATDEPSTPYSGTDQLESLVIDERFIHRPGGVTRDGRYLAYATNRGDGVAFDTWVRDLVTGEERCVFATGGWTGPGGFSPDGRYLAITELTTKAGDNRVLLVDLQGIAADDGPVGHGHAAV